MPPPSAFDFRSNRPAFVLLFWGMQSSGGFASFTLYAVSIGMPSLLGGLPSLGQFRAYAMLIDYSIQHSCECSQEHSEGGILMWLVGTQTAHVWPDLKCPAAQKMNHSSGSEREVGKFEARCMWFAQENSWRREAAPLCVGIGNKICQSDN